MKQKLLRNLFLLCALIVGSSAWAADKWVKTAPADLQTGDIVVIVDQTSATAMSNNNGTSSAPSATAVTLNGDKSEISSAVAATLQWVVTKNEGSYQFGVANTSNYLYCTNANNGVRVGSNADNAFTVHDNEGVNFLINTATSRYIGVYNSQDWRCYTSINSNIKNSVTAFYKKTEGVSDPDAIAAPTFDPVPGTYFETQYVSISTATEGATVRYTTDGSEPTETSKQFNLSIYVGSDITIKAIAFKDGEKSAVATANYVIVEHAGTEADPYTVADARKAIDAGEGLTDVYVKGIVCEGGSNLSSGVMNYWISDDGTETDKFEIYKGKGIGGASFESTDDVQVGDVVVVKGTITKYNTTYEFASGSQLVSIVSKADPELSFTETSFDIELGDKSFVAPTLVNPHGLTVTYASDNETIALVDENTGELVYDENVVGTATITATFAGDETYKAGSASYTINIYDPNVKGTIYNPYTVAEVIDGTATGNGIYVKGFIVGEFVGKTTNPRTSAFTTDANFALADAYTTSPTASESIPVQLGTNELKQTWGNETNDGTTMGYEVIVKGNVETYFNVNGIKSTSEVTAVAATVAVTSAGYATFVSDADLDYSAVDGLKAYKATVDGVNITFDRVTTVPAGEGVLLSAAEGTYTVPVAASAVEAWAEADNAFVRGTGEAVETDNGDGSYNYILNVVDDVPGFYRAAGKTVAKNRAYLKTSVESARIAIDLNGETTGISEECRVKSEEFATAAMYDLQGRRVEKPTKGLNIVNGKKVVVK